MIRGNEHIIVIFGMARSGTTVFTHVLGQHHKICIFHNVHNYENSFVFERRHQRIEKIVSKSDKRVIFKRPWSESMVGFYLEHMPDAYYIAMLKPFEMINESWKKSTWTDNLWGMTDEERRARFDLHTEYLDHYRGKVKLKTVDYTRFVAKPDETIGEVCDFLGLLNYRRVGKEFKPVFDTSMVRPGGGWSFLGN